MRAYRIGLGALGAAVAAVLCFASWILWAGGPASRLAAGSFALLAALLVAFLFLVLSPGRRTLSRVPEHDGVGLSNSPALTTVLLLMAAGFFLAVVGFVVIWIASGSRPVDAIGPTVVLILAAIAGVPFVITLVRGKYRLGGLLLTPESITYRSYAREHTIAWDDVIGTAPGPQPGALRLIGRDEHHVDIPFGLLSTPPAALTGIIEFYRENRHLRAELADRRSLERFASA